MLDRSFRRWLVVLALLGVTIDQASKYLVFRWLYQHPEHYNAAERQGNYVLIAGAFRLHTQYTSDPAEGLLRSWSSPEMPHVNHGALFGLGNTRLSSNYFFAAVSVVAAFAIVGWSFRKHAANDRLLCAALGLILGGTIGNLHDRLVFGGVRDFLYWNKFVDWPVFNVADCCLVVGAFALLFQAFLTNPAPQPVTSPAPQAADEPLPSPAVASVG